MQQQPGGAMQLLMPIALFVLIFYFLILRPQKKKQQQHEQMLASISRGDTVVSAGGFYGTIVDILDDSYIVEIADGVKARILKSSISVRRDAGEAKPRPQRPRKKDRPRRPRENASESVEGATAAQEPDGAVTTDEENTILMSAPDTEDIVEAEIVSEAEKESASGAEDSARGYQKNYKDD